MFSLFRQPSRSAGMAVGYVTFGTLAMIWAAIWYWHMRSPDTDWRVHACVGLFLSGLDVALIGFLFGRIGQEAKHADNTAAAVLPQGPAAVAPQPVQPQVAPVVPAVVPQGTVPNANAPVMMPAAPVAAPAQPVPPATTYNT